MALWHSDPKLVLQNNGADAYCYLLFLRMIIKILLPIWPISWIVLMPVNSVGTSVPGNQGLNRFTFGNIAPDKQIRYVAHIILLWLFTCQFGVQENPDPTVALPSARQSPGHKRPRS